jgi:hypothetical protein
LIIVYIILLPAEIILISNLLLAMVMLPPKQYMNKTKNSSVLLLTGPVSEQQLV